MRTFIILMLASFSFNLHAQEDIGKTSEKKETASQMAAKIRLAYDLAHFGYTVEAPLALMQAAEILMQYPQDDKWQIALSESGEPSSAEKENDIALDLNPEVLLRDAKDFAAANPSILAVIEGMSEIPSRGRLGGPGRVVERVEARSNDIYTIKFWANEIAEILVSGDGDTDLDLYVYDENNNLIAKDTDNTDDCYVRFHPKWTGPFTIKIVNHGAVFNRYVMVTN